MTLAAGLAFLAGEALAATEAELIKLFAARWAVEAELDHQCHAHGIGCEELEQRTKEARGV